MTLGGLRIKFKRSKDYVWDMLIRDLIEYAEENEKRSQGIDSEISSIGSEIESLETNVNSLIGSAGPWTPALTFSGGSVGIVYSQRSGFYQKSGKRVDAWFNVVISSKGSSAGAAMLTGLPFPASGEIAYYAGTLGYDAGITVPNTRLLVNGGGQAVRFMLGSGELQNTHFSNLTHVIGHVSYRAQ
jgi:hypothetical protein